jgi:hypothetical protein
MSQRSPVGPEEPERRAGPTEAPHATFAPDPTTRPDGEGRPPSDPPDGFRQRLRRHWLIRHWLVHRPLEHETALFLLVCALDLFMTYVLLRRGGFRESNPVADWFLMRWGFPGMIVFKFATAAVVTVIAQVVAEKRVRTARWLLRFGTLIVGSVVVYSLVLFLRQRYG